jgi:hypothetical protein
VGQSRRAFTNLANPASGRDVLQGQCDGAGWVFWGSIYGPGSERVEVAVLRRHSPYWDKIIGEDQKQDNAKTHSARFTLNVPKAVEWSQVFSDVSVRLASRDQAQK